MKVTFKGNTSKTKKFFPASEGKPAMLYVDCAEKINKRDGSVLTIWHKLKITRGYAETIYRGLHEDKPVSRFIQVEGRIVDKPTTRLVNNQADAYNTIWVDDITWLDNKRPENESGLPEGEDDGILDPGQEVEEPMEDEGNPWD